MSTIKLARIFTDSAVLQRGKDIRIWGFADDAANVTVKFADREYSCTVCDGRFEVVAAPMEKGGPYTIEACDRNGNKATSSDIMIGDVIIISGQSNMEFPMERVRESYPSEWDAPFDHMIRTFKVTENGVFGRSLREVETGQWNPLASETIDAYSAVGYFTAKHLRLKEDVAVGIVDLTLGGVPIEAFMSEEMLEGFDEALNEAHKFTDDEYRAQILRDNEKNAANWLAALDSADIGLTEHYEDGAAIIQNGRELALPQFFSDTELAGFIGSVWMARKFDVPKEYAGKKAVLYFGAITDFDHCYINGKLIGNTEYCYPPRRYEIPEGLINEKDNTIVFRIGVEKGFGRITPGKLYGVVFGGGIRRTDGFLEWLDGYDHIVYLSGVWKYLIGARCERSEDTVFVNWKPTALYNGIMAPLSGLNVKAFAFYQGESNCQRNFEYAALTERFVTQIRSMWGDIPYIYVQLPEFDARMEEISYDGGKAWRGLMEAQEKCSTYRDCHMVRAYGTGELNDLHPQRKEPLGKAIADIVSSYE